MKPSITSVASILIGRAALTSAEFVQGCRFLFYADGGVYYHANENGAYASDLGDFPAKKSFTLYILWSDDQSLYLLERTGTSQNYTQYQDKLYLDASPGAFQPLSFTVDNSTLAEGETSWGWVNGLGILVWSPTGQLFHSTPGGDGEITGQAFGLVEVEGYPGIKQVYWNQTLWEEVQAGRAEGKFLPMFYSEPSPEIVQGDRP